MRAGIGLVGILLAVGIIVYLFSGSEIDKIKQGEKLKDDARQFTGRSQDDTPATESFVTDAQMKGSKLAALQVTAVTPGGAMDTYYGLKAGDEIVAVGGTSIDALSNNDDQLAKAMVVQEGYQKQQTLTVRRSGQRVTLPLSAAEAAAAAAVPQGSPGAQQQPAAGQSSQQPAPPPQQPRQSRGLQGQLDAIQDAAGGRGQE